MHTKGTYPMWSNGLPLVHTLNSLAHPNGLRQASDDYLADCRRITADTCHSLQALVSLKVQEAAPLVLKARQAMRKPAPYHTDMAR